jgi:hypothetical protein
MDVVDLVKKRDETEARFNALQKQKTDIETELSRLQGEYRVYNGLIEEAEIAKQPDPASVIDAEKSLNQESEDRDGSK